MDIEIIRGLYQFVENPLVVPGITTNRQISMIRNIQSSISQHMRDIINPIVMRDINGGLSVVFKDGRLKPEHVNSLRSFIDEVKAFNICHVTETQIQRKLRNEKYLTKPEKDIVKKVIRIWLKHELIKWNEELVHRIIDGIKIQHAEKCRAKSEVFDFVQTRATEHLHPLLALGKACVPRVKGHICEVAEFNATVVKCLNQYRVRCQRRAPLKIYSTKA